MNRGDRVVLISKIGGAERIAVGRAGKILFVHRVYESEEIMGYQISWDAVPNGAKSETSGFVSKNRVRPEQLNEGEFVTGELLA